MTDFDPERKEDKGRPEEPQPENVPDGDADKDAAEEDDLVLEDDGDDAQPDGGVNKPSSPRQDVGH